MTRRALDETLSFVAAVDRAASPGGIAQKLLSAVRPFGVTQVLAGIIPAPGMSCEQQAANVLLHSWPEQWSCRYFKQVYLYDDPTICHVRSSVEPFLRSDLAD